MAKQIVQINDNSSFGTYGIDIPEFKNFSDFIADEYLASLELLIYEYPWMDLVGDNNN